MSKSTIQLTVNGAGAIAFKLPANLTDDADALMSAAAKKASLKREDIRLSHNGRLLEPKDTVQQLRLADGDTLLLHVRTSYQKDLSSGPGGFFIEVVTSDGKALWRPRVKPSDDAGTLIDAAVAKAPKTARSGSSRPVLRLRGQPLQPGKKLDHYGIVSGDEVVLSMDGGTDSDLDNTKAYGRDENKYDNKTSSSSSTSKTGGTKKSGSQGGLWKADPRQDLIDKDIAAAADLMYDAVAREVRDLRASNRRLRDELRYRGSGLDCCDSDDGDYDRDFLAAGGEDKYGTRGSRSGSKSPSRSTLKLKGRRRLFHFGSRARVRGQENQQVDWYWRRQQQPWER